MSDNKFYALCALIFFALVIVGTTVVEVLKVI